MVAMRAIEGVLRSPNLQLRVEQNCVPEGPLVVAFVVLEEGEQPRSAGELIAYWVAVLDIHSEETRGVVIVLLHPVQCVQHSIEFLFRHGPSPFAEECGTRSLNDKGVRART